MTGTTGRTAGWPLSGRDVWVGVATLLLGTLLPPLDFFIVNLAIPSIARDLGGGQALGQQVVAAYAASYAVMLTLGGRVGDLYGRRRVFLTGLLGFAASSVLCGLSPTPGVLVAGRVLQGLTAALMAPQSLALIRASLSGRQQNTALGLHGATFGLAAVLGQSLGGLLVAADVFGMGWRVIFLMNLPVAIFATAGSVLLQAPRPDRSERLDLTGAALLSVGLAALVVPLVEGQTLGWPWWCWTAIYTSVALLAAFWRWEQHVATRPGTQLGTGNQAGSGGRRPIVPLVPPEAVTAPGMRGALAALGLFYAIAAFFLIFSTYQQANGRSPLQAGLDILPLGAGFLIGPLTVPRLQQWLPRSIGPVGLALEAVGFVAFAAQAHTGHVSGWVAVPLAVIGFGQGLALPSLVRLAVTHTPVAYAGLASGLVNATLQISAALSVALIGSLYTAIAARAGQAAAITTSTLVVATLLATGSVVAGHVATIPTPDSNAGPPAKPAPR